MDLHITENKSLREIAHDFSARFPKLRLRFYTSEHAEGESSSLWDTLNMDLKISQVGRFEGTRHLRASGEDKVSDFEQAFQQAFHIGVQVLGLQNGHWEQITKSDSASLNDHNDGL